MASNLSSIGFPVESEQDIIDLARIASRQGKEHPVKNGGYLELSSQSGAELWFQIDKKLGIVGFNPHFNSESRLGVKVVDQIDNVEGSFFDGSFQAWANPDEWTADAADEMQMDGDYPFIFDTPDYRLYPHFELPARGEVQVAAFAHELSVFDSADAFHEQQEGEIKFAAESFIPSGLFKSGNPQDSHPEAAAMFTGKVLSAERQTNELTGAGFVRMLVQTLGGSYDVVADPELVSELPKVEGIVSGVFWLSGRFTRQPVAKKRSRWLFH